MRKKQTCKEFENTIEEVKNKNKAQLDVKTEDT